MELKSQRPESIPPPIGPRGFFTAVEIRPIIAGVVIDYVATMVFHFLYLLTYLPKEVFENGGGSEEIVDKAAKEMLSSPEGLLSLALIGAFGTALGGYVAGRMAKGEKVKHGALVGLASLVVGIVIVAVFGEGDPVPDWFKLLGYILPIPVGALGGYFAEKKW